MKQAIRYVIAFIAVLCILFILLLSATLIPRERVQANYQESAEFLAERPSSFYFHTFIHGSKLDYYADVSYGDSTSNNKTPETQADVYEAKFTVTKKDGEGNPLAGAGFVIKNEAGKYYKIAEVSGSPVVTWEDSIDEATECLFCTPRKHPRIRK